MAAAKPPLSSTKLENPPRLANNEICAYFAIDIPEWELESIINL